MWASLCWANWCGVSAARTRSVRAAADLSTAGDERDDVSAGRSTRARAAPTEQRDGHWMQGEVHDPRAHLLGGVAGHAGLFSTAEDLAVFAQMMLDRGTATAAEVLAPPTVDR